MAVTTLLDIAKANGSDPIVGLIDETTKAHPEISMVAARTIKGLNYKTWVRTGLPTAGFRQANQGVASSKSTYENRLVDTYIFDPRIEVDKAVADRHEDGAAAFLAYEAEGVMEAAMQTLSKQFYYGQRTTYVNSTATNGFPGLLDAYERNVYEYDAGGTTDNTATSVWAIKFGEKYVQWVFGKDGELKLSDVMIQRLTDSNNNGYTGYVQEILAYPGLQVGSLRGVGRIKKITDDSGHTLNDNMLAELFSTFEVGVQPDLILMNRRARKQLQKSRTVTLFGNSNQKVSGKEATLAPLPTEYQGVPIAVTDSISNTETLAL